VLAVAFQAILFENRNMTKFYEVWPASSSYHQQAALTYQSHQTLAIGQVVEVPLKNERVLAIVRAEVKPPSFKTKALSPLKLKSLPPESLKLIEWLKDYYPAPLGTIIQQFLPRNFNLDGEVISPTSKNLLKDSLPPLTDEQQKVVSSIKKAGMFLLHGRTGSGKTRVYQELAIKTFEAGRSAIILTPEIGLTSQLALNFKKVFGERVIILHSHLTPKERQLIWLKVLAATEPLVIIGARSALFTPLKNIGLIVVDESHESAYKQEQAPYYQTSRVAGKLAGLHQAQLVLGSATPSVVDYYIAEQKGSPILRMDKLATSNETADLEISIIDLKDRSQFSHQPHLSNKLLQAVAKAIENGEQSLIFINRRGTARLVCCAVCGWQALCPNCDVPLTYHGDEHLMRCHICNYRTAAISNCPVCASTDIIFRGIGTKALLGELQSAFPSARLQRFDSDNKKAERFEHHYEAVLGGDVDILVGTQTLAKGLDLPRLSVVGIINADAGLAIPDFTAQEKTYQLISQVLGRIGRGHRLGRAIIQTYAPSNLMLQAALKHDWQSFYSEELKERQQFTFPPFCYLLKLTCRRATTKAAEQAAEQLARQITDQKLRVIISGPAPSFHEKHGSKFEWQLIIKAKRRPELLKIIALLPSGWSYDIDPNNLL
jgi:primosomal protein N' (replication factor Y)